MYIFVDVNSTDVLEAIETWSKDQPQVVADLHPQPQWTGCDERQGRQHGEAPPRACAAVQQLVRALMIPRFFVTRYVCAIPCDKNLGISQNSKV